MTARPSFSVVAIRGKFNKEVPAHMVIDMFLIGMHLFVRMSAIAA